MSVPDSPAATDRGIVLVAIVYGGIALGAGVLIAGLLLAGCENVDPGGAKDVSCTAMNDYGGVVLLVGGPPIAIAWAAMKAHRRKETAPLHKAFLCVLGLLPILGLALPQLLIELWPA